VNQPGGRAERRVAKTRALVAFGLRGSRRLGGFTISTALLALGSLALMPATIHAAGLETWSSIVLAQALALIIVFVGGCGYGYNGPTVIAALTPEDSVSYFFATQRTRFVVAVPCFAVAIGAMFIVPNPDPIAGLLGGAPLALSAFSASFFFVGRAAPRWMLVADTGPRVTLMLAGAIMLLLGGPLIVGLALPVLGTVIAIAVSNVTIRRSVAGVTREIGPSVITGVRAELRNQLHPLASSLLRGGAFALPVFVITAVAAELVGVFGVFDRIRRQALAGFSPVTLTIQGWVPRRMANENTARAAVAAMAVGIAAAFVSLLVFTILGRPIIRLLAADALKPTFTENLLCGAVIATMIVVQVNDLGCLVPLGEDKGVLVGNVVGIIFVVAALLAMLSLEKSVTYALGAIVIGNVVQIVTQIMLIGYSLYSRKQRIW
jgi:hypothetical protein